VDQFILRKVKVNCDSLDKKKLDLGAIRHRGSNPNPPIGENVPNCQGGVQNNDKIFYSEAILAFFYLFCGEFSLYASK